MNNMISRVQRDCTNKKAMACMIAGLVILGVDLFYPHDTVMVDGTECTVVEYRKDGTPRVCLVDKGSYTPEVWGHNQYGNGMWTVVE